jgi:hypothetical protein
MVRRGQVGLMVAFRLGRRDDEACFMICRGRFVMICRGCFVIYLTRSGGTKHFLIMIIRVFV